MHQNNEVGIIKSQKITKNAQFLHGKPFFIKITERGREISLYQRRLQLGVLWCTKVSRGERDFTISMAITVEGSLIY